MKFEFVVYIFMTELEKKKKKKKEVPTWMSVDFIMWLKAVVIEVVRFVNIGALDKWTTFVVSVRVRLRVIVIIINLSVI